MSEPGTTPLLHALKGRCPRCGEGRLFRYFIQIEPTCSRCGLDLARFDQGDGPAFFALSVVSLVVVGGAFVAELAVSPPFWLHALLWVPLAVILTPLSLRLFKAWLISEQFRHKAEEGRLED